MLAGTADMLRILRWWWKSRRDKVPSQPTVSAVVRDPKLNERPRAPRFNRHCTLGEAHVITQGVIAHAVIERSKQGCVPKGEPGRDDIANDAPASAPRTGCDRDEIAGRA